jgi:hypothetical protein
MVQWVELWLREDMPVHVSDLEEGSIIGPDSILEVSMVSRPIIEVKPHIEYLAPQEWLNIDALLQQDGEVLEEQIARNMVVLELHHVVNQVLHSFHLVVFQGNLNRICIVVSISFLLCNFHLVNNWKFTVEELLVVLTEELPDRIGIKGEY